jgi:hypothetical protein
VIQVLRACYAPVDFCRLFRLCSIRALLQVIFHFPAYFGYHLQGGFAGVCTRAELDERVMEALRSLKEMVRSQLYL